MADEFSYFEPCNGNNVQPTLNAVYLIIGAFLDSIFLFSTNVIASAPCLPPFFVPFCV